MNILPPNSHIGYSDNAQVSVTDTAASFNRGIPAAGGISNDNPGARIRFRTDATSATATLNYTGFNTLAPANSVGGVLVDGVATGTFTCSGSVERIDLPVLNQPNAAFHDIEIILPYAAFVEFNELTVNDGAALETIQERPATQLVAYGDSITQGYAASDIFHTFPWLIGTEKDWSVINMGFGGRVMTPSDAGIVAALRCDILTVLMGVNDSIAGKTASQFRNDYEKFIADIRLLQPDIPIYAITSLFTTAPYGGGALLSEYRGVITDLVRNSGDPHLFLVDGLSLIPGINKSNYTTWMPDGIHPNDAGFALIARNLAPQLNAIPEPSVAVLLRLAGFVWLHSDHPSAIPFVYE